MSVFSTSVLASVALFLAPCATDDKGGGVAYDKTPQAAADQRCAAVIPDVIAIAREWGFRVDCTPDHERPERVGAQYDPNRFTIWIFPEVIPHDADLRRLGGHELGHVQYDRLGITGHNGHDDWPNTHVEQWAESFSYCNFYAPPDSRYWLLEIPTDCSEYRF